MKRLASIILIALLLFSLASCVSLVDSPQESESNIATDSEESSTPDTNNNESDVNKFILKEVKNSWHDSLLSVLAQVGIYDQELDVTGSFAAGLMDLDFDNTPEVILAYHGGSMGNVPLEIYDLNTGEKLDFYSFSHYDRWDNVYLCVAQTGDEYVIIEKGSIRITGADYVYSVGTVKSDSNSESDYIQMSPLFSIENEDEKIIYEYMGKTVDKVEYDAMYQQFLTDYVIIEETQLQLIKWENFGKLEWKDFGYKEGIDPESHRKLAEKMAEALINSSQEFVYNPNASEKYSNIRDLVSLYKDNLLNIKSSQLGDLYWEDQDYWNNRDGDKQSNYQFAVVDMNGDGIGEIILKRFSERYIVFYNKSTYKLDFKYLDHSPVLTDGTYGVSSRAGDEQMCYQYDINWESTCLYTRYFNHKTDDWEYYIGRIGDIKVSEEEFLEYSSHFSDTMVEFFDLTEDNINKYITVKSIKK